MTVNITQGTGSASVAAELVGTLQYQRIEVMGQGGASVLAVNPDGSFKASIIGIPTVLVGGSVAAVLTGTVNQSVSGTVGASIIGIVPVQLSNSSVITVFQSSSIIAIVTGSVNAAGNQSVSGTIGASIIGQLPAGTAPIGSVATLQGTNPWTTNFQNSSILAVPVGSVVAVLQSSSILAVPVGSVITVFQAPSIVGTYAEDAPSASGDKGFLVMGARNDTLASVTSNDGDYSSHVVGPAGELIAENAPLNKWVSGTASMLGGVPMMVSVNIIAAQGASIFTYITGVQVANLGSASVLVSFGGATSSLIGYTIAPAGGGSNIYFQNGIKTNANAAFSASISGTASIYVSAQGFISKT